MAPSAHRDFHQASGLARGVEEVRAPREATAAEREARTDPGKRYGTGDYELRLPAPALAETGLAAALAARRSTRAFLDRPVAFAQVGAVLGAYRRSGALELPGFTLPLRTVPSAGGLYPIEVYLVAKRVTGLPAGLYHYRPLEEAMARVGREGEEAGTRLGALLLDPGQAERAAGAIVLTARFARSTDKYRERGYRYALLEAGGVAQVFALAAAAAGVGMVCHGAFFDGEADRLLGLDGLAESALVVLLFGAAEPFLDSTRGDQSAQPRPRR